MILPMIRYLEGHGVRFHYNTKVTDVKARPPSTTTVMLISG